MAGITELTKENAKKVVNAVLEGILTVLEQSGTLRLANFGTFTVKQTKERQGINPKTQQPITIPAGYRMGFKVSSPGRREWCCGKGAGERQGQGSPAQAGPKAKMAAKAKGKKK